MGADWSGFEKKMKKWFADVGETGSGDIKKANKDTGKTAKLIADEYEKAIKKGKSGPPSGGCKVLSYNKAALKSAMKSAFDMLDADETGASKPAAGMIMAGGFVGFWTGGMFSPSPPASVQLSGIVHTVIFPGAPIPVSIPGPNDDAGSMAGAIAKAAKSHAGTIAGLQAGLAKPWPHPPLPVPWVGLK